MDTIAEAWLPPPNTEGMPEVVQRNFAPIPGLLLPAFSAEVYWGVLPDGLVAFSDSSTYTVKIAEPGTGVVRILRRPLQPRPVTRGMIRAEKDRRLQALEESGAAGDNLRVGRRRIEELKFHTELAVIRGLRPTWDCHIWVLRRGEGPHDDGPIDALAARRALPRQLSDGIHGGPGRLRPRRSGGDDREERVGSADRGGEAGGDWPVTWTSLCAAHITAAKE